MLSFKHKSELSRSQGFFVQIKMQRIILIIKVSFHCVSIANKIQELLDKQLPCLVKKHKDVGHIKFSLAQSYICHAMLKNICANNSIYAVKIAPCDL